MDYPNAHEDLDELKVNDALVSEQSRHQWWVEVMLCEPVILHLLLMKCFCFLLYHIDSQLLIDFKQHEPPNLSGHLPLILAPPPYLEDHPI